MGVVPHVQHLVVLGHIRDSMTTSVLRSSGGGGSRPPEPEFQQHDGVRIVETSPNPVQTPNKASPLIGGRNREREIYRIYLYFSGIFCVEKEAPSTSIYRGKRGCNACQLAMWY